MRDIRYFVTSVIQSGVSLHYFVKITEKLLICVPQKNYSGIFPKFEKKTLTMEESFFVKISVYKPAIF